MTSNDQAFTPCRACAEPTSCASVQGCEKGLSSDERQIAHDQDEANEAAIKAGVTLLPWRPIEELTVETRYGDRTGFLLKAPELVDLDCNVHGVGMGYWQDGRDVPCGPNGAEWGEGDPDRWGGWLACKWSMTNDEWSEVSVTPTHYLRLTGV